MKKQILILFGVLVLSILTAGCGKKKAGEIEQEIQATVVPAEPVKENKNLVEFEKTDPKETSSKNIIGNETASAQKMIIKNKTGSDISYMYIRPNFSDDEDWGKELIQGSFVLKNDDEAIYFYEKGDDSSLYDVRIGYTDVYKNECFFRKLPLKKISQILLCMDGTGEDSIPYARYLTGPGSSEYSTLEDVKRRLGILYDYDDEEDSSENSKNTEEEEEKPELTPTEAPEEPEEPAVSPNEGISVAEGCIGKPLSALLEACGEPNGTTYENEPETGETGYHYYNGFTVSTTVDENGNEIVAGVW